MKLESNVLVMGKSGVGKSSFINYVYGADVRETGSGKPVTKKGLHIVSKEVEHIKINLYDTWGLEADKSEEWSKIILDEVSKHNESFSIKDWFHTIYYCMSAQSARVETFEIESILKPLIKGGNKVVVILTHCDVMGAETKSKGMIETLLSELSIERENIICVASEGKKKLGGGIKEPFGRNEVFARMKANLWFDIRSKLPKRYESYLISELNEWKSDCDFLTKKKIKFYNRNSVIKKLVPLVNNELNKRLKKMEKVTSVRTFEAFEYYKILIEYLEKNQSTSRIDFDEIHNKNSVDFELDFNDIFGDNFVVALVALIPVVGLFAPFAAKSLAQDKMREKTSETHKKLIREVPNIVSSFESLIDEQCSRVLLLESSASKSV